MDFSTMTVNEIKAFLLKNQDNDPLILDLLQDSRKSVNQLGLNLEIKNKKLKIENDRIKRLKEIEETYYHSGYSLIAGLDEVGRGPLAGPVVTCAIILPRTSQLLYTNDSKKLSKKKRRDLSEKLLEECLDYAIGRVDEKEIDAINIFNATKKAMEDSLTKLHLKPDVLLLDAITINTTIAQQSIIQGDAQVYSIAAASIVAKVFRDHMMVDYHKKYPQYGFNSNMGYGTAEHIAALKKYGPTPIHRKSFIQKFIGVR